MGIRRVVGGAVGAVRERGREAEGWLGVEVPRALTGIGGVPVLWDGMR